METHDPLVLMTVTLTASIGIDPLKAQSPNTMFFMLNNAVSRMKGNYSPLNKKFSLYFIVNYIN